MTWSILTVAVEDETDVVLARQRARQVAAALGFDVQDQTRVTTAVSEIVRNAFEYGGGGRVEFRLLGRAPPQSLEIVITDRGAGIANLDDVLEGRHRSQTGMGVGLRGARRLMDGFDIDSAPGRGPTIRLRKQLSARTPFIAPTMLAKLNTTIGTEAADPMLEVRRQNRELLLSLDALRSRQEELSRLNDELEDTNRGVVALYAELDEKADHLRRADELKTRFLSNMSHEFRTPLNSILALSRMLMDRVDGELTDEQDRQLSFIRSAAENLSDLVNDLLDLAKVEAGKVEINPAPFAVEDLFGALRGMLKPLLISDSVSLVFESAAQLPTIVTDEAKVSQILRNFLSNAIKFTEHGEIRVWASDDGADISFWVRDTGTGIALEDQVRIFDEFAQVDSPMQRRVKGTGLGLPLSKRLAELLRGRIAVESTLGVGSTFCLTIPRTFDVGAPTEPRWQLDPARLPVLAVEDSEVDLTLYERYLAGTRYQLIGVKSLGEARAALASLRPRAVLLDVTLAGALCWPLLAELKRNWTTREIPVLVAASMEEGRRAIGMGADDYALKPMEPGWLVDRLDQLIGTASAKRVLVIDDDVMARYLIRRSLPDYIVTEAASADEGLRRAALERPDAICLDLVMPGIDGYTVLERLGEAPETRAIPVVIVTSSSLSAEDRSRLARAAAILAKDNLSDDRLGAAIAQACARAASAPTEQVQHDVPSSDDGAVGSAAAEPSEDAARSPDMESLDTRRRTVLLVEDDAATRSAAAVILAELGYGVIEADSGEEALEILRRSSAPIALLVTDLVMPGISGMELAHLAKQMQPALKLLYTSAYVRTLEGNPALRYGPFVEKPWLRQQIKGAIEKLIGPETKPN
jgi:signal transduction histidine kinase/CheY-like chemotaxis protein